MAEYKAKRYSGPLGPLRWGKDKLLGLPKEADQIFTTARDHYVVRMQTVISHVADTIGTQLDAAKARIAKGRSDLQDTVKKLPADLRAIGAEAAEDFAGKFDELNQQVDEKSNDLVQTLASKYNEALKSVDDEIAKEKEKDKGLVNKAIDAVKGVIKTILELKNLLFGVLRKAASAVMMILKDPIGFLKNLVGAVGTGLKQFLKNIVRHLEQGLVSWLLGVTAQAGLTLPKSFDVKGILMLIAGLLGLTWQFIRSRIVRKIPERVVAALETGVTLLMRIRKEGVLGLWEEIKERIGDLKHNLIGKITEYLVPTIIVAGIMWVISLLNPASAFVRACKAIIDIVQFIVERGRQIIEFVNAVLDAVIAIAKGGTGGVPGLIENALARSIPVLIGFLAALLGIGGIADKVKKIFEALSKPVMKAVDWVVDKIVGLIKKLWAKLKSLFGRVKRRFSDRRRRRDRPDHRSDEEKRTALAAAVRDATRLLTEKGVTAKSVRRGLPAIEKRHDLTSIRLVEAGKDTYFVELAINPEADTATAKLSEDDFPYKIGRAEDVISVRRLPAVRDTLHRITIPMLGRERLTGYVINMPAGAGVPTGIAMRYLDQAWVGSPAESVAAARTAVIIGVNTFERLDPATRKAQDAKVDAAVMGIEHDNPHLQMAAFGFVWTPRWMNTRENRPASLTHEVRPAYERLASNELKAQAVAKNEGDWREDLSRKLPYGVFREQIFLSTYTETAVRILAVVNREVRVLLQDPDTGVKTAGNLGFLGVFDEVLREAEGDPLLVIGGYHFEHFDWGPDADPHTRQLTLLANRLDRALREAIGKVFPEMLYPTEQTTLVKVWEDEIRREVPLIFQNAQLLAEARANQGTLMRFGRDEGRAFAEWLKRTYGFSMVYNPHASVSTDVLLDDPRRGYAVTPELVHQFAEGHPRFPDLPPSPVYAVLMQSQSVAGAFKLASALSQVRGIDDTTRTDLRNLIFTHVETVAKLMAANPRLTIRSAPVKRELDNLERAFNRLVRGAGEGQPHVQELAKTAHDVTEEMIKTMTAAELKSLWRDLSLVLKAIRRQRPTERGQR
jgi:Skp family chaperone for outer membrane proteins